MKRLLLLLVVSAMAVSLSGFTVTWEGHEGPGNVYLSLLQAGYIEAKVTHGILVTYQ